MPRMKVEDVAKPPVNGVYEPYSGNTDDLPVAYQTQYQKRVAENLYQHKLSPWAAAEEARVHIARLMWRNVAKKREKAAQLALLELPRRPLTSMRPNG
jgi:hypothetical protein